MQLQNVVGNVVEHRTFYGLKMMSVRFDQIQPNHRLSTTLYHKNIGLNIYFRVSVFYQNVDEYMAMRNPTNAKKWQSGYSNACGLTMKWHYILNSVPRVALMFD